MKRLSLLPIAASDDDLNITACVDIFAVVTMYLVYCYAVSGAVQRPLSDIILPRSTATSGPAQTIKISVSRTAVRIDNQLVMQLQSGQFAPIDVDDQRRVLPLFHALEREKLRLLAASRTQAEFNVETARPDMLYLEAARGLPYGVVDRVVRTAAAAGFTHLRLAAYHKERAEL